MSNSQVSRQRQAAAFKSYCAMIQVKSGLSGAELQEHIRETIRQSYVVLFNSTEIRQRNMNEQQLARLTEHRENMVALMQLQTK